MSIIAKGQSSLANFTPIVESVATTSYDYSGNATNLSGSASPTIQKSTDGKYLINYARASSQYSSVANELGFTNAVFSWAGWVKTSGVSDIADRTFMSYQSDTYDVRFFIAFRFNTPNYEVRCYRSLANGADTTIVYSAGTLDINNRYIHVACTWNGANLYLYLNGVMVSSVACTAATGTGTNTSTYWLGTQRALADYFNGNMSNCVVMMKAWNGAEIKDIMRKTFIQ